MSSESTAREARRLTRELARARAMLNTLVAEPSGEAAWGQAQSWEESHDDWTASAHWASSDPATALALDPSLINDPDWIAAMQTTASTHATRRGKGAKGAKGAKGSKGDREHSQGGVRSGHGSGDVRLNRRSFHAGAHLHQEHHEPDWGLDASGPSSGEPAGLPWGGF